jgi:hypothetical protein
MPSRLTVRLLMVPVVPDTVMGDGYKLAGPGAVQVPPHPVWGALDNPIDVVLENVVEADAAGAEATVGAATNARPMRIFKKVALPGRRIVAPYGQ